MIYVYIMFYVSYFHLLSVLYIERDFDVARFWLAESEKLRPPFERYSIIYTSFNFLSDFDVHMLLMDVLAYLEVFVHV